MIKKFLSREIHIYEGNSVRKIKELTVAEVEYNSSGQPISVKTDPFQKEQSNTEYIDPPLIIRLKKQKI